MLTRLHSFLPRLFSAAIIISVALYALPQRVNAGVASASPPLATDFDAWYAGFHRALHTRDAVAAGSFLDSGFTATSILGKTISRGAYLSGLASSAPVDLRSSHAAVGHQICSLDACTLDEVLFQELVFSDAAHTRHIVNASTTSHDRWRRTNGRWFLAQTTTVNIDEQIDGRTHVTHTYEQSSTRTSTSVSTHSASSTASGPSATP